MYVKRNDSFLYTCKETFFLGIHPLSSDSKNSEPYKSLVAIFNAIPESNRSELFLHYLLEEKYNCDLWAATILLQFSKPSAEIVKKCKEVLDRVPAEVQY
ncbi:hypothetical protein [Desertivirga arenae]|uniref:hypothetical protein n=1 Tax=Desertivirga arenae TaxID=2810309 RepID=UPI001A96E14F|nr:hypothetical protein [Pedobacter sp. SYSU D00823]